MNERQIKLKKQLRVYQQHQQHPNLDRYPSARRLQASCLPKDPLNIAAFAQYAHPRKQELKENSKHQQNQQHRQHHKNVLLQPRKSNQGEDCLRKTQKRMRNRPALKNQLISLQDEGLGCNEHLSSQIFRQSGHNSICEGKGKPYDMQVGQEKTRPITPQQQIQLFEQQMPSLAWQQQHSILQELINLQEQLSKQDPYTHYLHKQPNITWKRRAIVLDWTMLVASQLNCRRQAFALSVSLLDRYLAIGPSLPLSKLQLTAAACLLLAEKLQDNSRIRSYSFYQPISAGHSLEELLEQENQVVATLKFKLRYPTVNSWSTWLCGQWDGWAQNKGVAVRFKAADSESYHNWRWLAQYIDFALLDLQTLQYKNRTLAASFLYLTLILRMEIHTPEEVAVRFRKQSKLILADTSFNRLFSCFLVDILGFPLEDILPTIQYCSNFAVLPVRFQHPVLLQPKELSFEEYCGIQTWNECNKGALEHLDRTVW